MEIGADDNTGWNCVIKNTDIAELNAQFVKVAHHGSRNAFCKIAWEQHAEKEKPIAVLTPFSKGAKLPDDDVIEMLKKKSKKVGITSQIKISDKLHDHYSKKTVTAINEFTRSFSIIEEPNDIGFIRVRFLLNGEMTSCHATPPSHWL